MMETRVKSTAAGLEKMHRLTASKSLIARVYLTDWNNKMRWAQYDSFQVQDEAHKYALRMSGDYENI